ncbi:MAG TPA: UDP-3-O-(3-hydroxymyristoyl)glucosamine N-acyltransferase [Planctomycetota bacterium]|nr:UDP-3-O-(3-hydroxymyristoyl)glucosamine N-acyltransferase [Planctomycetota bacterium]
MQVTVNEIAALVGGTVVGDGAKLLTGFSGLKEARPGDVSFLANAKYAADLAETKATAVLVANEQPTRAVQIVVANPDRAFGRVASTYGAPAMTLPRGVHPTAVIGERVRLGRDVAIGAYAVLGDGVVVGDGSTVFPQVFIGDESAIGRECVLYAQVAIRERCQLGDRVIIHSGAVIGSDGFGYATVSGVHHKIPQVGVVIIEDDVEIGANAAIDRARFGRTRIGKGTKIDNLVQIAHNVETGQGCIVVAQVGVAGSTRLGNYVTLAGQCGVSGHLEIGDQAIVAGQSGVSKNVPAKAVVRGYPAQDMKSSQLQEVAVRRLPQTQETVKQLAVRVAELEARLAALVGAAQAQARIDHPSGAGPGTGG